MKTLLTLRSCLVIVSLIAFAGVAQAKDKDKKASKKAEAEAPAAAVPVASPILQVSLQEETFSLPIADAAALLRKFPSDAERYKELARRVDAKQARLERLVVLRTISGQQAKVESINELTYPSESDSAHDASGKGGRGKTTVSLQTRNVGDTLNFTPQISDDGRIINLTLIPEKSFLAGYNKGPSREDWTHLPILGTSRLTTSVIIKVDEPFLLGTFTPPSNNGIVPQQKDQRTWLEFITAQIPPMSAGATPGSSGRK